MDDHFDTKNSLQVTHFLKKNSGEGFRAFAVDVKDLYYSLPHDLMLSSVVEAILGFGPVRFPNECGESVQGFLELLDLYLKSTYVQWIGAFYIQKKGVCIGSCVAPAVSNLAMAHLDRIVADKFKGTCVIKVFRYVDDFLVVLKRNVEAFHQDVANTLGIFKECLRPPEVTHEAPQQDHLKFLDLCLKFSPSCVCWRYKPGSKKTDIIVCVCAYETRKERHCQYISDKCS